MKLTNTTKRSKKGMTLLELTVVILVLLSLISILFIGARAWKKGSDRAGCIMNIRNAQQAVRSYQNMNAATVGAAIVLSDLVGPENFLPVSPACPESTGTYTALATVPPLGTLYLPCSLAGTATFLHVPAATTGW